MSEPGTAAAPGSPDEWPEHIRARYGITDRPWWRTPLVVLVGLGFTAAVVFLGWRLANPAIKAGVAAYAIVADDRTTITFEVQRRDLTPATCVVRARAEDGLDVGYATVELPPASGRTAHTYELATAYRALVGELVGCGIGGPPPGIPGAQFRPGIVPPEQPWTPPAA